MLWLWLYVDFFLILGFYCNDVEYRHKYYNKQHISIRKYPCFIVCMIIRSSAETPSVTSVLGLSVQPTKSALPIRFLYEQLPNIYVFSEHKMFTTFCAPFPNRISRFKIVAMP